MVYSIARTVGYGGKTAAPDGPTREYLSYFGFWILEYHFTHFQSNFRPDVLNGIRPVKVNFVFYVLNNKIFSFFKGFPAVQNCIINNLSNNFRRQIPRWFLISLPSTISLK